MAQTVLAGITMSLDGYITGPNDGPGAGLGDGGERLHWWVFGGLVDELMLTIAPVLLGAGKRLFDGMRRVDLSFERTGVIESPWATHIRYRLR